MAFFLIGRGPDDDLRLISPKSFESRQAAMGELSLLSAEPTFAHWDAEVSVMDLDTGAPVLLVRSGVAAAPAVEPVVTPADASGAWEADLPQAQVPAEVLSPAATPEADAIPLEPASAPEPAVAETPATEIPSEASDAVPEAIGASFWEPPSMALIEPVEDQAIADAIVEEASTSAPEPELEPAAVPVAETAPEPAVDIAAEPEPVQETPVIPPAFDENDELRAAILRTTEHMSAEGVVPPESVGLEPAEVPAEPEASPEAVLPAGQPVAEPAVEPASAEIAAEAAPPTEAVPPAAETSAQPKVGFWPWARAANSSDAEGTGVAPEVAGVYDALQEPATGLPEPDVEAALRDSVLLPTEGVADAAAHASDAHLPMSSLPASEPSAFVPAGSEAVDSSDFILDLDAVESAPVETAETVSANVAPAPAIPARSASDAWSFGGPETPSEAEPLAPEPTPEATPEPVAAVSPLQDYTCEDCVYVTTCPNRDQRLPKDCGSFQWR